MISQAVPCAGRSRASGEGARACDLSVQCNMEPVSDDPPYGEDPGGFPPPVDTKNNGATTRELICWESEVPYSGVCNNIGGSGGTGNLYFQ